MENRYEKIVSKCCNHCANNSRKLAEAIYSEYQMLDKTEEALIGIYVAMVLKSLSTYELEKLTGKRLVNNGMRGWCLVDVQPSVNVDALLRSKPCCDCVTSSESKEIDILQKCEKIFSAVKQLRSELIDGERHSVNSVVFGVWDVNISSTPNSSYKQLKVSCLDYEIFSAEWTDSDLNIEVCKDEQCLDALLKYIEYDELWSTDTVIALSAAKLGTSKKQLSQEVYDSAPDFVKVSKVREQVIDSYWPEYKSKLNID